MERESNFKRMREIHGDLVGEWSDRQNKLLKEWDDDLITYHDYRIKSACATEELELISDIFHRLLHTIND